MRRVFVFWNALSVLLLAVLSIAAIAEEPVVKLDTTQVPELADWAKGRGA